MTIALPESGTLAGRASLSGVFDRLAEPFHRAAQQHGRRDTLVTIAGVRIRLSFAGEAMRERLLPALTNGGGAEHGPSEHMLPPDFTLLVWDCTTAALPPPEFPWRHEDLGARGEIAAATNDSIRTAFAAGSSALSMLDLDRGVGLFRVRDAEALPWYERAAPFRTLLHWILESRGCRFVHAAAVATAHGGALLAGRGGSGKSTTAMLCVEQGFDYAGDDYAGVTAEDVPHAHTLFTSAKLSASSLDWLPFLRPALRIAPHGDEKGVALLGELFPRQIATSFPLRAVLVPRIAGGASRLQKIGGGAALRALAPTTLLQLPGGGAGAFASLAELVRRLPAWSLELGHDRAEIPRLVAQAIEESR
jgi:hypothetical protein